MLTFNGDASLKQRLINYAGTLAGRVQDNKNGREILRFSERDWCPCQYICQKGPGCDHKFYSEELGVPVAIAYCERALFLELPTSEARMWWPRFLQALPVGARPEVSQTWFPSFALKVLIDNTHGLIRFAANSRQTDAIANIAQLFKNNCTDESAWQGAALVARDAYHSGPYNNARLDAKEALIQAGAEACHCAANFAWSYSNERSAAIAMTWAGWCARYRQYSNYMSSVRDPREDVHKVNINGIDHVDVSESLAATFQWIVSASQGDREGEIARANYTTWIADQLILTIDPAAQLPQERPNGYDLLAGLFA